MCGGTKEPQSEGTVARGLSPRVRGNLLQFLGAPQLAGSIPACAGEPDAFGEYVSLWEVYPRVCGGTGLTDPAGRSA